MHDRLEIAPRRGVGEHDRRELLPIDRAIHVKDVGAEPGRNRTGPFRARRHHAVRERVGIQTRHPQPTEALEHMALAGCDTTRSGDLQLTKTG